MGNTEDQVNSFANSILCSEGEAIMLITLLETTTYMQSKYVVPDLSVT